MRPKGMNSMHGRREVKNKSWKSPQTQTWQGICVTMVHAMRCHQFVGHRLHLRGYSL